MARDILSAYGPNTPKKQVASSNCGGVTMADKRDVMNYKPPTGPRNINDGNGPGLHGDNYGNCGTQGTHSTRAQSSGRPGLGGDNSGNSGTQGG